MRTGTKLLALYAVLAVLLGIGAVRYLLSFDPASAERRAAGLAQAAKLGLPTAPGDSGAVAGIAISQCGGMGLALKEKCYQDILFTLVAADRLRLAMGSLHLIMDRDPEVLPYSHQYAHGIGIAAYTPDQDVGRVFRGCTDLFNSGCYHGVIQSYFVSRPKVEKKDVKGLCADFSSGPDQWLHLQCVHGMGHGLTMFFDHDLPRALASCDLLAKSWDRQGCYGGAFMENVMGTTIPHHHAMEFSPSGMPHDSQMAGHDMPGMQMDAPGPRFKSRDPADPYYPCSIVAGKYLETCYGMQTSIMLELNGRDFGATAKTCDGAPEAWRYTCYQSLGTNISGDAVRDDARAIRLCSLGNPHYQPWCFLGVAKDRITQAADPAFGVAFCAAVPEGPNRMKCYQGIGQAIAELRRTDSDREAYCAQSEEGYREACRFGAWLTRKAPAGMPLRNRPNAT